MALRPRCRSVETAAPGRPSTEGAGAGPRLFRARATSNGDLDSRREACRTSLRNVSKPREESDEPTHHRAVVGPCARSVARVLRDGAHRASRRLRRRAEEHTSELQSREKLVCRLLLEKRKAKIQDK